MFYLIFNCYVMHACSLVLTWAIILCWLDRNFFFFNFHNFSLAFSTSASSCCLSLVMCECVSVYVCNNVYFFQKSDCLDR